ncbi:MAG: hypothetical protein AB1568_04800 [Thermodesulfobacteriota bacterium]
MFEGKVATDSWYPVLMRTQADPYVGDASLTDTNVNVYFHKLDGSGGNRAAATIGASDWVNKSGGEYQLRLGAVEFASAGNYQVTVIASGDVPYPFVVQVKSNTAEEMNAVINSISPVAIRQEMDSNSVMLAAISGYIDTEVAAILQHLVDIKGAGWTNENLTTVDANVDTLLARLTATRAGYLDAAVSSRLAAAGYTAPPTAAAVRTEMDANSTKLANLDAAVSSRLAAAGYTAPPTAIQIRQEIDANSAALAAIAGYIDTEVAAILEAVDTEVAAIKAKTDNLPVAPSSLTAADVWGYISRTLTSATGGGATAQEVWEYATRTLTSGGGGGDATAANQTAILALLQSASSGLAALRAVLDAILADTGTDIPTQIAGLNNISVANILAGAVEGSMTLQQALRVMLAALAGRSAGGGTATITMRDQANTKNRITATVDANGNRSNVTVDGT